MLSIEEIRSRKQEGDYIAVCESGKEYQAKWTNNYGGVMFFCIPSTEIVLGYKEGVKE